MELTMGTRFLTIFAVYIAVVCRANVVSSANTKNDKQVSSFENCDTVNSKFAKENIVLTQPIHRIPFHDASVRICYSGTTHPHHKSCCSREAELKYNTMAKTNFLKSLKSNNVELKLLLGNKYAFFQERFLKIIKYAENRTDIILSTVHSIYATDRRPIMRKLFAHFEQFLLGQLDSIEKPVDTFFSEIFPFVFYKKDLTDRTVMHLTDEYRECLIRMVPHILPKPFGNTPTRIVQDLRTSFYVARLFLESIQLTIHTLDVTEKLSVDEACLNGLTKMHFCSKCDGHTSEKPCRGLCLNVMRGCLSKMMAYGQQWDELLSSLSMISQGLKGALGYQELLDVLESEISESLMHALSYQHRYYAKITNAEHCGPAMLRNDTMSQRDHEETMEGPPALPNLYESEVLPFVRRVVGHYHGWHAKVADVICNDSMVFEQSLKSGSCWTGKHISLYTEQIPDPNLISQMKYNSEVKVTHAHNPHIAALKDKFSAFRKRINKYLYYGEGFQSDQAYSGDGGYDSDRDPQYWVTSNDQMHFDNENSGSGSGGGGSGIGEDDEDGPRGKDSKGRGSSGSHERTTPREFDIDPPHTAVPYDTNKKSSSTSLHPTSLYSTSCLTLLALTSWLISHTAWSLCR